MAADTAARVAREARQDSLKPYYVSFKRAQSLRMQRVVPDFVEFVQRPAVKPLWEPADAAPMSTSAWSAALPAIRDDFIAYQEELRVEAIRAIICATTGDWQQATSRDSADYPRHKYDEDWFERPTALFWGDRADNRAIALALPYPETLWGHFAEGDRKEWLRKHIDNHTSRLVRLVLEAAGMDEDTARQEDFVGVKFRWVDNPYKQKKEHERLYNWVELVRPSSSFVRRAAGRSRAHACPAWLHRRRSMPSSGAAPRRTSSRRARKCRRPRSRLRGRESARTARTGSESERVGEETA